MISWTDVNVLEHDKKQLQVKLSELIKSGNFSEDEVNGIKAEILYLDKQISKIVGSNEIKRQKELKQRKSGIEQANINAYYSFKDKYKKINKMKVATTRMINEIDEFNRKKYDVVEKEVVKVKVV